MKENFKEVMKMNYTSLVDNVLDTLLPKISFISYTKGVYEIHNSSKHWENKMVKNFAIGDLIKAKNVEKV